MYFSTSIIICQHYSFAYNFHFVRIFQYINIFFNISGWLTFNSYTIFKTFRIFACGIVCDMRCIVQHPKIHWIHIHCSGIRFSIDIDKWICILPHHRRNNKTAKKSLFVIADRVSASVFGFIVAWSTFLFLCFCIFHLEFIIPSIFLPQLAVALAKIYEQFKNNLLRKWRIKLGIYCCSLSLWDTENLQLRKQSQLSIEHIFQTVLSTANAFCVDIVNIMCYYVSNGMFAVYQCVWVCKQIDMSCIVLLVSGLVVIKKQKRTTTRNHLSFTLNSQQTHN